MHYRQGNSDRTRELTKRWYQDNRDHVLALRKRHYEANHERIKEQNRQYHQTNRERIWEQHKLRRQNDPEALREQARRWRENNPQSTHCARKATPRCLPRDQRQEIAKVYKERQRVTKETDIAHEVDHIVPITGRVVSGLNVAWNLRILTEVENGRRPRIWRDQERNAADFSAEGWAGYKIDCKGNGEYRFEMGSTIA
jgi:hypothetical protein